MSPLEVNHCRSSFFESFVRNSFSISTVFCEAIGFAPSFIAFSITPSVPLRPTFPPIPAIGFTSKPIFETIFKFST